MRSESGLPFESVQPSSLGITEDGMIWRHGTWEDGVIYRKYICIFICITSQICIRFAKISWSFGSKRGFWKGHDYPHLVVGRSPGTPIDSEMLLEELRSCKALGLDFPVRSKHLDVGQKDMKQFRWFVCFFSGEKNIQLPFKHHVFRWWCWRGSKTFVFFSGYSWMVFLA